MKLNDEQIVQFSTDVYLLLRGALTDTDLDPIIAEYQAHVDVRAEGLLAAGKISQLYADEPFDRRLISICRENDEMYKELDIMHFRAGLHSNSWSTTTCSIWSRGWSALK